VSTQYNIVAIVQVLEWIRVLAQSYHHCIGQTRKSAPTKIEGYLIHDPTLSKLGGATAKPNILSLDGILKTMWKKYHSRATWLLLSIGIMSLSGGSWAGFAYFKNLTKSPVSVNLLSVEQGDIEITFTEAGMVELGGQKSLKAPRDVTIEQVLIQEGQRIPAGQTLLVMRDREGQKQFQEQVTENRKLSEAFTRKQAIVTEKLQKLGIVQKRYQDIEMQFNQGNLPEVEKLNSAEKRYQDSQDLFKRGLISQDELQGDKEKVSDAQSAIKAAQEKLQGEKEKVDEASIAYKDAEVEQRSALLDVQRGQDKLREIQQQLSDRLVKAPFNSIVLKLNVNPGDGVKTEGKLLTLGDPSKEIVKLQFTTLNAAKVHLNQLVRVSTIGPNPKTFTGRLISLSPQATPPNSEEGGAPTAGGGSDSQTRVNATAILDKPSGALIPGSQVSVEVVLQRRQNVLTIPLETLQQGDRPFVWVKDASGNAQKREITLGLQGLSTAEVKSGLRPGEQILQPPPNQNLTPGTPLQIDSTPSIPSEPAQSTQEKTPT
jgi:HlyD family secretion protein